MGGLLRRPFDGIEDYHRFELTPLSSSRRFLLDELHRAAVSGGADAVFAGNGDWDIHQDGELRTLTLSGSDVLYIPRGVPHAPKASARPSVHVTLGMEPVYLFHLVGELAAAEKDPAFGTPLPLPFADPSAREDFERSFRSKIDDLLDRHDPAGLVRRQVTKFLQLPFQGWENRLSDTLWAHRISLDTVLRKRSSIVARVERSPKSLTVRFTNKSIEIPSFLGSWLDTILAEAPFCVRDVRGLLSDEGKVELAIRFVHSGLLRIERL